jgi:hypothetical protein
MTALRSGWAVESAENSLKTLDECPNRNQAWLRLSASLTDGYFSVRGAAELNGNGPILKERKLVGPGPANPNHRGYNPYRLDFDSRDFSRVLVYVGLWGVGRDAWVQVDDVEITSLGNLEDDAVPNPAF